MAKLVPVLLLLMRVNRVWDKVISGSCKILVFVAMEILLTYKIKLMGMSRADAVVNFLSNVRNQIHNTHCFVVLRTHTCLYPSYMNPFKI